MRFGCFISGNSFIHNMDSRAKLISLVLIIIAIAFIKSPLGYAAILTVFMAVMALSKLKFRDVLSVLKKMWIFFLIIFAMNAFFFKNDDSIFSWWIFNLTLSGILQGINVVFRIAMVMMFCNIFMFTTTPIEVTNALEYVISPLKLFKLPVRDIAMILGIALRFIPTLLEEADTIKMAQLARGAGFDDKNLIQRAKSYLPLVIPIFISAFRRADELSLAMEARGYRKNVNATKKSAAALHLKDYGAICASLIICGCLLYFK